MRPFVAIEVFTAHTHVSKTISLERLLFVKHLVAELALLLHHRKRV
jgi:hypothetical protein